MDKNDTLLQLIKKRIYDEGGNYVISITGHPNSGKSYAGLDLALSFDKSFTGKRVCFTLKQYYDSLLSMKQSRGKAIMIDEAGAAANSKRAMHSEQVDYSDVIKTQRFKGNLLIITSPDFNDYIKDGRKLVDCIIHFHEKHKHENETMLKPKNKTKAIVRIIRRNYYDNKIYMFPLNINAHEQKEGIIFDKPPEWLIKEYKAGKTKNFDEIIKRNLAKLKKKEFKELLK